MESLIFIVFLDRNRWWTADVSGPEAVSYKWLTNGHVCGWRAAAAAAGSFHGTSQAANEAWHIRAAVTNTSAAGRTRTTGTWDTSYVDNTSTVRSAADVNGPTTIESPGCK